MRALDTKRFLVTGGCGFMGSDFIRQLLVQFPKATIVNVDALTYAAQPDNLVGIDESRYSFVKGDITDRELMIKLMQAADFVINFAAETHVDRSIADATAFVKSNVLGVHTLLEALRSSPHIELMVHISTDEVWGDLPLHSNERFSEESPFCPNSPYAASKAGGDLLVRAYAKTYKLPVIVTHSANNYGLGQYPEKLIPYFILCALQNKPMPLYGTGENMRDWLYVEDHSAAVLEVLQKGESAEVYAIAQEEEFSNKWIAEQIADILGKPRSLIVHVEDRLAHDQKYATSAAKIRKLSWKPVHTLKEKLPEVVLALSNRLSKSKENK